MKVLVMTAVTENLQDLRIMIVARISGVSPLITLKGEADNRNGNPYLIYDDVVAEFTGIKKYNNSINVFDCSSGNLENWI